jgi:hypothetical protein
VLEGVRESFLDDAVGGLGRGGRELVALTLVLAYELGFVTPEARG